MWICSVFYPNTGPGGGGALTLVRPFPAVSKTAMAWCQGPYRSKTTKPPRTKRRQGALPIVNSWLFLFHMQSGGLVSAESLVFMLLWSRNRWLEWRLHLQVAAFLAIDFQPEWIRPRLCSALSIQLCVFNSNFQFAWGIAVLVISC